MLESEDGLRQVRGPAPKTDTHPISGEPYSRTGVQMNFEERAIASGKWDVMNVHLDVVPN